MTATEQRRVIKRYANRKLYDTEESCYVTHEEIALLVRSGEDIQIIDNQSKEDLTRLTLAQILTKEERRKRRTLPLHTLKSILQTSGEKLQERITQQVSTIKEEAVETVRSVLRPGETGEAGELQSAPEAAEESESVREWLDKSQRGYETLARTVEERWDLMVNALDHLEENRRRISQLEERICELEAELQSLRGNRS
jgi:polyhydroxyalkanoate synthesis repressor PhaR